VIGVARCCNLISVRQSVGPDVCEQTDTHPQHRRYSAGPTRRWASASISHCCLRCSHPAWRWCSGCGARAACICRRHARYMALALRSLAVSLLIVSLSGVSVRLNASDLAVAILLDRSASVERPLSTDATPPVYASDDSLRPSSTASIKPSSLDWACCRPMQRGASCSSRTAMPTRAAPSRPPRLAPLRMTVVPELLCYSGHVVPRRPVRGGAGRFAG
jgi:hypothetical protein